MDGFAGIDKIRAVLLETRNPSILVVGLSLRIIVNNSFDLIHESTLYPP
jgi:hypothetical protein